MSSKKSTDLTREKILESFRLDGSGESISYAERWRRFGPTDDDLEYFARVDEYLMEREELTAKSGVDAARVAMELYELTGISVDQLLYADADFVRTLVNAGNRKRNSDSVKQATSELKPLCIEKTERKTPDLDPKSVDWIRSEEKNEKILGLTVETLRKYRTKKSGGRTLPCEMFGIDRDGRIWRRSGTRRSRVFYYRASLP